MLNYERIHYDLAALIKTLSFKTPIRLLSKPKASFAKTKGHSKTCSMTKTFNESVRFATEKFLNLITKS